MALYMTLYKTNCENISHGREIIITWKEAIEIHNWIIKNIKKNDNSIDYELKKSDLSELLNDCYQLRRKYKLWRKELQLIDITHSSLNIFGLTIIGQLLKLFDKQIDDYIIKKEISHEKQWKNGFCENINYIIIVLNKILKETDFTKQKIFYKMCKGEIKMHVRKEHNTWD